MSLKYERDIAEPDQRAHLKMSWADQRKSFHKYIGGVPPDPRVGDPLLQPLAKDTPTPKFRNAPRLGGRNHGLYAEKAVFSTEAERKAHKKRYADVARLGAEDGGDGEDGGGAEDDGGGGGGGGGAGPAIRVDGEGVRPRAEYAVSRGLVRMYIIYLHIYVRLRARRVYVCVCTRTCGDAGMGSARF